MTETIGKFPIDPAAPARIDHIGQNGNDGEHYDNVYVPKHYQLAPGLEAIDVVEAVLGEEGFKAYCHGNVLKYMLRAKQKNGVEDLKKARQYINFMLED